MKEVLISCFCIDFGDFILSFSPHLMISLRSYIKNSKQRFIRYPSTLKWVNKLGCTWFFNPLRGVWKSDETLFLMFDVVLPVSVVDSRSERVNPLNPNIKIHFLLSCPHTFIIAVVGRNCENFKRIHLGWSYLKFSGPRWWLKYWHQKEKFHADVLLRVKETLSWIRIRRPGSLQIAFKYPFPSLYFSSIFRPEFSTVTATTSLCHFESEISTWKIQAELFKFWFEKLPHASLWQLWVALIKLVLQL